MKKWKLKYSKKADKKLEKLDKPVSKIITQWMLKNIHNCENPRAFGKLLTGGDLAGQWRYEIGDYRVLCDIQDENVIVLALNVGHRSKIYKR